MIDVKHLKNGDKFLVSRELEDGTIIRDIPCTLVNGLFQDDKTNQVYGSSVFAVTIESDTKRIDKSKCEWSVNPESYCQTICKSDYPEDYKKLKSRFLDVNSMQDFF